tara:strand:- start:41 stop:493 length:453 start_codon:yes stop_codon:yes gene_type:complete
MKYIFLLFFFLFTLNCSLNKVSNNHGSRFIESKYDKIIVNKSNKNDVRKIIGPPSSVSEFDNTWFFIERKKVNQSLLKLGKKKIATNNIIILEFNVMGLVSKKNLLNLNDMNDVKIVENITEKKFGQDNVLYDVLSSLRDKVNAPSKRSK